METPVIRRKLLDAATDLSTAVAVDLGGQARRVVIYIEGSAGVSAGAVTIEEAASDDYSGTWSAIGPAVTVVASTVVAVHLHGCYAAIRTRISTAISDGSVTTRIVAN